MKPKNYRCLACRTRRSTFVLLLQHCADHGHQACSCGGYHYPHRPGSPCCDENPMAPLHRAMREGAEDIDLEDIEMDCVWHGAGREMKTWPEKPNRKKHHG